MTRRGFKPFWDGLRLSEAQGAGYASIFGRTVRHQLPCFFYVSDRSRDYYKRKEAQRLENVDEII